MDIVHLFLLKRDRKKKILSMQMMHDYTSKQSLLTTTSILVFFPKLPVFVTLIEFCFTLYDKEAYSWLVTVAGQ